MFQSVGWDNKVWMNRLKCIGNWWATIVVGLFIIQAVVFTINAQKGTYSNCPVLKAQYEEFRAEGENAVLVQDCQACPEASAPCCQNN